MLFVVMENMTAFMSEMIRLFMTQLLLTGWTCRLDHVVTHSIQILYYSHSLISGDGCDWFYWWFWINLLIFSINTLSVYFWNMKNVASWTSQQLLLDSDYYLDRNSSGAPQSAFFSELKPGFQWQRLWVKESPSLEAWGASGGFPGAADDERMSVLCPRLCLWKCVFVIHPNYSWDPDSGSVVPLKENSFQNIRSSMIPPILQFKPTGSNRTILGGRVEGGCTPPESWLTKQVSVKGSLHTHTHTHTQVL